MPITCSICKKPILDNELWAEFDRGKPTGADYVHFYHVGVKELFIETYGAPEVPEHMGVGRELRLRQFPVKKALKHDRETKKS